MYRVARPHHLVQLFYLCAALSGHIHRFGLADPQCLPSILWSSYFAPHVDTIDDLLAKPMVDFDPEVHNQDLIGFFTSIPVSRILSSVSEVVQLYISKHRGDIQTDAFSVRLDLQDTKLRIWKGRQRQGAKKTYLVYLRDVVGICRLSCECSVFAVMGKVFDSNAVLLLGTRFPPCSRTVSLLEQHFLEQHPTLLQQLGPFYCVRYVDNRLLIVDSAKTNLPALQSVSPICSMNILLSWNMWYPRMPTKSFWDLISSHIKPDCIYSFVMNLGRFVSLKVRDPYIKRLQPSLLNDIVYYDTFGLLMIAKISFKLSIVCSFRQAFLDHSSAKHVDVPSSCC